MPWFRVDDDFWRHPKATNLSLASKGLWVSAGSWVAGNLTDGLVRGDQLHVIAPTTPVRQVRKLADELVDSGLWLPVMGGSYSFHEWHDDRVKGRRNPSREEVERERQAWRDRQRKARQGKRAS